MIDFLDQFAPRQLAEDWDNVGLLVGDRALPVQRIMTCLTITPSTACEAIERSADLIVSHHPLPFHALKRITVDSVSGKLLWDLIQHRIAVYSPHTAFDSASEGINQSLATLIGLTDIQPIALKEGAPDGTGVGRHGVATGVKLHHLLEKMKQEFDLQAIQYVGSLEQPCQHVAVACGSGASFLKHAIEIGCDTMVTGEASFHYCLEAQAQQVALVLLGHFASERFACEKLADRIQHKFPAIEVWAAAQEQDPIAWT